MQLTNKIACVGIQPKEIGRALYNCDFFLAKFWETVAKGGHKRRGVVAFIYWILSSGTMSNCVQTHGVNALQQTILKSQVSARKDRQIVKIFLTKAGVQRSLRSIHTCWQMDNNIIKVRNAKPSNTNILDCHCRTACTTHNPT